MPSGDVTTRFVGVMDSEDPPSSLVQDDPASAEKPLGAPSAAPASSSSSLRPVSCGLACSCETGSGPASPPSCASVQRATLDPTRIASAPAAKTAMIFVFLSILSSSYPMTLIAAVK